MNTTITSTIKERTVLLSKKGMKELRKAIAQLEHDRQMILKNLRDLSKTTSHDDRLDRIERLAQLEAVENELSDKHATLNNAKLIPSRSARLKVAIGSVVDLIDQQGQLFRYTLVDSIEANPSDGRISISSPLGQNLLGKTVRDIVEWSAGLSINQARLVRVS
jgi:transcription elongation factor GreA